MFFFICELTLTVEGIMFIVHSKLTPRVNLYYKHGSLNIIMFHLKYVINNKERLVRNKTESLIHVLSNNPIVGLLFAVTCKVNMLDLHQSCTWDPSRITTFPVKTEIHLHPSTSDLTVCMNFTQMSVQRTSQIAECY
jgi:hypothetical protein